jgi:hypothetical protein
MFKFSGKLLNGPRENPFLICVTWRELKDHLTDCYFRLTNMTVITAKPKHGAQYPNSPSGIKPVLHSEPFPVTGLLETWREDGEN